VVLTGRVDRDGFSLDFVREGSGIPMLVIGSPTYYRRAFPNDLRRHFDVVFGNLRFFVPAPDGFDVTSLTRETYSDDIEAIRKAAELPPAIVVGHSIAGLVALEYARRHPDSVRGVALVATPPVGSNALPQAIASFFDQDADAHRRAAHERNLSSRRLPAALRSGEDLVDHYIANGALYWRDPTFDARPLWEGTEFDFDVINHLNGTLYGEYHLEPPGVPVFVGLGRYDYVVPYPLWDEPRGRIPTLHVELFDESGHTPQYEEPQRFTAALTTWASSL
jgi:proline iminopeptidase